MRNVGKKLAIIVPLTLLAFAVAKNGPDFIRYMRTRRM